MQQIKGVVFDIGGVLFKTYQEHMFYDPRRGVIDRCGLDRDQVQTAAGALGITSLLFPVDDSAGIPYLRRLLL